jgi:hypothetical protein
MAVLWATWNALTRRRRAVWLAVASLLMGLTVGSRPTYLLGAVILLTPLAWEARKLGLGFWRRLAWWRLSGAALGPIAAVGIGLALYNYFRFENPLEFGQTYQMAGDEISKLKLFSLDYFPFNARVYLTSAPSLSPYFPFLTVISPPATPTGQFGIEDPYGVIPVFPWTLLGLGTLMLIFRSWSALGLWCAGVGCSSAAVACTIFCFGGTTGRYMVDFVPALVLLGAVGGLYWESLTSGFVRRAYLIAAGLLCLWSCGAGVLLSMQHNRLLWFNHRDTYKTLARALNRPSHLYDKLTGVRYGPLEMRVVFPQNKVGKLEPLVSTGSAFLSDYLYVFYESERTVRFGIEHTSHRSEVGPPVSIAPGSEHIVKVEMPSLYPPADHPFHDDLSAEDKKRRSEVFAVSLDGRPVLGFLGESYDAVARAPDIGTTRDRPAFKDNFTGRVVSWRRLSPPTMDSVANGTGALKLVLRWPAFAGRLNQPLLCAGETGRGDLLYVAYEDERHISIGHDHWGVGVKQSGPIEITPGALTEIEIRCPPLGAGQKTDHVEVIVDGKVVLSGEDRFHPASPGTIVIGKNPIGASTAHALFTGEIISAERISRAESN